MKHVDQATYYGNIRTVPYDLLKELTIALIGTLVVVAGLTVFLSSPDQPPETIQSWAQKDPVDLVTTAAGELAGTTVSAQYGAPYDGGSSSVQSLGFFSPQAWIGIRQPVDSAQDFVLGPLQHASVGNADLAAALTTYSQADPKQQAAWLDAYTKALKDAKADSNGAITMATGDYGPLPAMMDSLLGLARSGGLDGALVTNGRFYQTDYTMPLLFMGDGSYLASLASDAHLLGNQWGMMNETGTYPGQSWLWLYTMWYQLPPFNGNANADIMVVLTVTVLSLGLVVVPFLPILRDLPRWIPLYRLIWRDYYREEATAAPVSGTSPPTIVAPPPGSAG
jgi:hypothetical protein